MLIAAIRVEICVLVESVQPLEADTVLVSSSKLSLYVLLHFCSMPSASIGTTTPQTTKRGVTVPLDIVSNQMI